MDKSNIDDGIIMRIYVENFVTYDKVVITPGRNLNLIIGPNGTGKSTIVCAIVLGLGGKPGVIGRASNVGEYVKSGRETAKIEIDLKDSVNEKIVICRTFDIHNHSTWQINGQNSSNKHVQQLTEKLNIQVDNLCQFLPQDKVQDFSNMNPQTLLEETERSVGDPRLLVHHLKLKEYRHEHKGVEKFIADKTKLFHNQKEKYETLKQIVGNINEKKRIKKKILTLKQKKAWMFYDEKRKELTMAKAKKDEWDTKMKSLDKKLKPVNNAIVKIKDEVKLLERSTKDYSNQITMNNTKVNEIRESIHNQEDSVQEIEDVWKRKIQMEQNRDQEILLAQQQKSKLNNDLTKFIEDFGSEEEIQKKQREYLLNIDKQRNEVNELKKKYNVFKQQEEQVNQEIRGREIDLKRIQDVDFKRMEILKQRSPDAHKGVLWLRENLDKFSCTIHEPMILNINVKNAAYAKFLETIIPFRDLTAFVCEDKQNMNKLLGYLRDQQRLQVNVLYFDPDKNVQMNPRIPIENLMQYGFESYLVSLLEAPRTIMKYLVSMCGLQNIPIGNNTVEENADKVPNSLNCFFSSNNMYSVNISKYTRERSMKILNVTGNNLLQVTINNSKLRQINQDLANLNGNKTSILKEIQVINGKVDEANRNLEKIRETRNKYQKDLQQIQAIKSRIIIMERKIEELNNEKTSIEEINATYKKEIQTVIKKQLVMYKQCNSIVEDCIKYTISAEQSRLKLKIQQRKLVKKENESQQLRDEYDEAKQICNGIEEDLQPLKNDAERLYRTAVEITNGVTPKDPGFKTITAAFGKLPPTIQEIDKELNSAQARVCCMGKDGDGENVMQDFEKTEKIVQNLTQAIEEKTTELEKLKQKIIYTRDKWLQPLEELIQRIHKNFSDYFAEMKCAGEVSLVTGENEMDFDQYGLKIMVKFRDTDQLQELTRHHQSGGERAVTTALYMIALQELSRVPFRCVDEINQGMDASNERRVFELLVKITARPNSSQYFLLTPKLLPALTYSETVTVHCVYNGPFMIPHNTFNIIDYCENIDKILENDED